MVLCRPRMIPPVPPKLRVRQVSRSGFYNASSHPTSVPSFSPIGRPQLLAPGTLSQTMTLKLLLGVNIRANIFWMEKQNITISDECSAFRAQLHSPRSKFIYDIIEISHCGLTFQKNSRKIKQYVYSLDLNVHCEICAYSRFCETKQLKGDSISVLHSLFSLPPST